jgi:hypothetical protein
LFLVKPGVGKKIHCWCGSALTIQYLLLIKKSIFAFLLFLVLFAHGGLHLPMCYGMPVKSELVNTYVQESIYL